MAKDLFSNQSADYARYRPSYPADLFNYIIQFTTSQQRAWDCATGNGQAAIALAEYFEEVSATDISARQLEKAITHSKIKYAVSSEENSGFSDNSFDLVTVAQAYHWFNFEGFKKEVIRVLKPTGIVAVWGYSLVSTEDEALNNLIIDFYTNVIGKYWDPERKYVDDHYSTIPFPFTELPSKEFSISTRWSLEDFIGYLNSWSSVQHYIKANQNDPVKEFGKLLAGVWGEEEYKIFRFPVFLRIGHP